MIKPESKLKISSIIIAKNEEANIEKCIASQIDCIDEIVVFVDDQTNDKTFELAEAFDKTQVYKVKWQGFSKTKQLALEKTSNDWIFWIDADEAVRDELADEINEFKLGSPKYNVYSVARRAYFLGKWIKHSGWYPGRVERLFNKKSVKFSDSDVHEHLVFEGGVGQLKNDLDHYTDPNVFHYFEKFNKYTSLAAEEMNRKGKKIKTIDFIIRPPFLFFKMLILRKGILDGFHGLILALLSSFYVFVKYSKLWEIQKGKK